MQLSMIVEKWDAIMFEIYNVLADLKWIVVKRKYSKIVEKNRRFKDLYIGNRCFILLNGPSLKEHDLSYLENEVVFTTNYFYKSEIADVVKPDFICWQDSKFLITDECMKIKSEVKKKLPSTKMIFNIRGYRKNEQEDNVFYTYNKHLPNWYSISNDLSNNCSAFSTVAFYAINCAIYMGFKEIYVLGLDFGPGGFKHFTNLGVECDDPRLMNNKREVCTEYWSYAKAHFESFALNKFAIKKKCRIVNLNPESYIRAFEFGEYEKIFK